MVVQLRGIVLKAVWVVHWEVVHWEVVHWEVAPSSVPCALVEVDYTVGVAEDSYLAGIQGTFVAVVVVVVVAAAVAVDTSVVVVFVVVVLDWSTHPKQSSRLSARLMVGQTNRKYVPPYQGRLMEIFLCFSMLAIPLPDFFLHLL